MIFLSRHHVVFSIICLALNTQGQVPQRATTPIKTAEDCRLAGHELVTDTGNGRIFRPDYRCPAGGKPLARVRFGIEGALCCPRLVPPK